MFCDLPKTADKFHCRGIVVKTVSKVIQSDEFALTAIFDGALTLGAL